MGEGEAAPSVSVPIAYPEAPAGRSRRNDSRTLPPRSAACAGCPAGRAGGRQGRGGKRGHRRSHAGADRRAAPARLRHGVGRRAHAPLTTLSGRLPPDLTGVLWRNGPAEHERFRPPLRPLVRRRRHGAGLHLHRGRREPPRPHPGDAEAKARDGGGQAPSARLRHPAARRRADHGARRHERRQHLRARPWRAAHGALGGGLGAGVRFRDAGSRRLRRVAARTSPARPSRPTPRWRRTAPAGTSAASPSPGRCCCSTASTRKAGSPRSTPCRSIRSAWCTTTS